MRTLYCIQHVPYEHPGVILQWAKSRKLRTQTVPLYNDSPLPNLTSDDLLLVMGGPMGAFDAIEYPWINREKQFLAETIDKSIPAMGICLGAQLIAAALGANGITNPYTEIGFFPVAMTKTAAKNPLFSDIPRIFTPFHWHSDTFFIPKGAIRIAGNDACMNQGFVGPGKVLGLQFHLEATPSLIQEWAPRLPPLDDPPYVQSRDDIVASVPRHTALNRTILETVLDRFYLATI